MHCWGMPFSTPAKKVHVILGYGIINIFIFASTMSFHIPYFLWLVPDSNNLNLSCDPMIRLPTCTPYSKKRSVVLYHFPVCYCISLKTEVLPGPLLTDLTGLGTHTLTTGLMAEFLVFASESSQLPASLF